MRKFAIQVLVAIPSVFVASALVYLAIDIPYLYAITADWKKK